MGWKRFEKELRKAGKSVEKESKRVVSKVDDEITRLAERKVKKVTDSELSEVPSCSPGFVESIQHQIPIEVKQSTDNVITDNINPNPDGLRPGKALIINHLTFVDPKLSTRTGSVADVSRLKKIFRQFGIKVKRLDDGTLADVKAAMESIADYDFKKFACLIVVIMSHGYESNIIAAKDGEYSLDHDIMYPILRNRTLSTKLKFIVTESCKGPVNPLLEIEGPRLRPTTNPSEILQLSSCVEGYVSYIDTRKGSIFITTLCDHLEKSGLKDNIIDIANAVVADVKHIYNDIQIPMMHTNLTKQFIFGHYTTYNDAILEEITDGNSSSEEN